MTTKRDCSGRAYGETGFHRCFRNATVQRDGKHYCWQHDPIRIEADKKKRRAAYDAEWDKEAAKYARIARNARLGKLVTEELPALLERLATYASRTMLDYAGLTKYELAEQDMRNTRNLAARIREALGLEVNDDPR